MILFYVFIFPRGKLHTQREIILYYIAKQFTQLWLYLVNISNKCIDRQGNKALKWMKIHIKIHIIYIKYKYIFWNSLPERRFWLRLRVALLQQSRAESMWRRVTDWNDYRHLVTRGAVRLEGAFPLKIAFTHQK